MKSMTLQISKCLGQCPYRRYSMYICKVTCELTNNTITNDDVDFPDFCPLEEVEIPDSCSKCSRLTKVTLNEDDTHVYNMCSLNNYQIVNPKIKQEWCPSNEKS